MNAAGFSLAPVLYVASAAAFIVGLKALTRARGARQGRWLVAVAFVLALAGGVAESLAADVAAALSWNVGSSVAVAVGAIIGFLGAARARVGVRVSSCAWIVALAALAAGAIAWPGGSSGGALAWLAFVFAAIGFVAAVVATLGARLSVVANARAALAVTCTGAAVAAIGFAHENVLLLIAGGMAGTAGIALGRTFASAVDVTWATAIAGQVVASDGGYDDVRSCQAEEAALLLEAARSIVVVPGFGMAAAQAQHAVKELAEQCTKRGARVVYAVHPTAGCMPGHMNIALDEANVPHDQILSLDDANRTMADVDVALVVGANDIVNPNALLETDNPLSGMPVIAVDRARHVLVVKRSMAVGNAGTRNPLFERTDTTLLFGDAKKVAQALVAELKSTAAS